MKSCRFTISTSLALGPNAARHGRIHAMYSDMPRTKAIIRYGKRSTRTKAERVFAELPQSPVRKAPVAAIGDTVDSIVEKLSAVRIKDKSEPRRRLPRQSTRLSKIAYRTPESSESLGDSEDSDQSTSTTEDYQDSPSTSAGLEESRIWEERDVNDSTFGTSLRVLTWDEVCPPGDCIQKIAEASYAEVYRVTNERGTSVIKVIRLPSPIKPQTKAQVRSKLVDEEPHSEEDVNGELQISEWLADVPGFVVYKERYLVEGKTSRALLETHQSFHRRVKRRDPGRAQFYPSPSRYLDDTRFLVVELGDAGVALEDWTLNSESQLWDIFFLEAIALARAEEVAMFEHRDLHEGNLCIKRVRPETERDLDELSGFFGYSGLDITILDFGLSRAEDVSDDLAKPIAYDLERDLSLFTSTHAPQCKVYRQMRSFLLRADRTCLAPEAHQTPYARGVDGPLSWQAYAPYTNVLWLAYLYDYLLRHFSGHKRELAHFRTVTSDMWTFLDPDAEESVPCFGSAGDIVCFAVEAGWIHEDQLLGSGASLLEREDSIIVSRYDEVVGDVRRRSPRHPRVWK